MKKITLVLGAAAIALFASQALVVSEAEAAKKVKYCVWHEDPTSTPNAVLVSSDDIGFIDEWTDIVPGAGSGATGSLANHLRHGDELVKSDEGDVGCDDDGVPS
jgi:hypothetical protein